MRKAGPWLRALPLVASLLASPAAAQGAPAAAESPQPGQPTWYAQAMAHGDAGLNVTHFWSKGAKMRAETVIAGHKIVTIVNGEHYLAYDALQRKGVAIRRTPAAIASDSPTRRPFGRELESLIRQGAEKVDVRPFQGAQTEIYRVTDELGRREVWVNVGEARLPVRTVIFQRATSRTQTTDYLNWVSSLEIGDGFFEPDSAVEFERLGFQEYMERSAKFGPVGPVPVLYADLLHGNRRGSGPGAN